MLNAIKFPLLFASLGLSLSAFLCTGEGEILAFNPPFHSSLEKKKANAQHAGVGVH